MNSIFSRANFYFVNRLEQLLRQGASMFFEEEQEWKIDGVKTEVIGFYYQAYRLASFQLRPYMVDPAKKYILTGHSLGGALASMLAIEMTQILNVSILVKSIST